MKEIKDVIVYRDFNFKTCYPGKYTIQVIGNKARVLNDNPVFGAKTKSRLNKLNLIGGINDASLYALKVEGQWVYLKLDK